MIHVLSYNVARGKKIDKIYTWITTLSPRPDIICLQEFPQSEIQKKNFFQQRGYKYEFVENIAIFSKKYGQLTAYNKKKIKLSEKKIVHLGKDTIEVKIFGYERQALLTTMKVDKKVVTIANVHLVLFAGNKARENQLSNIIKAMPPKVPAVILGDFNYPSMFKKNLEYFLGKKGFTTVRLGLKTFHLFGIRYQLDYVFVKNCTYEKIYTVDIPYSDHFPLLMRFSIK